MSSTPQTDESYSIEDRDYWEDVPDVTPDLSELEYLSHDSPTVGRIVGRPVSDPSWVDQDSTPLECRSCKFQLQVEDRRWFGRITMGMNSRNGWAWKLLCPCCEQDVVIVEKTYDDGTPETIKQAYSEEDVMSEESLEVSLERVMNV